MSKVREHIGSVLQADRRVGVATPSRSRLIHLLIEERAKVLRWQRGPAIPPCPTCVSEADRDQARREIEAEVLTNKRKTS